jgi:beta-glucosidase
MSRFPNDFLFGAATAAHQVEGNNKNSDYWAMEQLTNSNFAEPSLDACDHYNRYAEDIQLMADAGLNAYRFSIEWARIEPTEGEFSETAIQHYRRSHSRLPDFKI